MHLELITDALEFVETNGRIPIDNNTEGSTRQCGDLAIVAHARQFTNDIVVPISDQHKSSTLPNVELVTMCADELAEICEWLPLVAINNIYAHD